MRSKASLVWRNKVKEWINPGPRAHFRLLRHGGNPMALTTASLTNGGRTASVKTGFAAKQKWAGWDRSYLLKILAQT
jgi:hypothetical protein